MSIPAYIRNLRQHIGTDLIMAVGVSAIIRNSANELLLQQRTDNHLWGLPSGILEPLEEPAEGIIREVREETGLEVLPERLVGVYGGPSHLIMYANGDQVAFTAIVFECRIIGGELRLDDDETLNLQWFAFDSLPATLMSHHRPRIEHAYTHTTPYFRVGDA